MDKKYVWNIIFDEDFIKDEQRINQHGVRTYSTFEKARENYFNALKEYFLSSDKFDGEDYLRQFEEYFDDSSYDDEEEEDERMSKLSFAFTGRDSSHKARGKAKAIPNLIRSLISEGEINPDSDSYCTYTDYLLELELGDEKITAGGVDDGPYNGVDPFILIDFFRMDEPDREYKFQVAGGFNSEQVEKESYFVLELVKTEVDAPV